MFITIGLLSSLLWFYMFPLIHQWFIQSLIITIDILSSHISFYRFPSMQQWFWLRLNFLLFCAFLICSIFVLFLNSWLASFQISFEVGFASEFMAVGARRVFFTILLARMFFFQYGFGGLPLNCMCLYRRCTTLSSALWLWLSRSQSLFVFAEYLLLAAGLLQFVVWSFVWVSGFHHCYLVPLWWCSSGLMCCCWCSSDLSCCWEGQKLTGKGVCCLVMFYCRKEVVLLGEDVLVYACHSKGQSCWEGH